MADNDQKKGREGKRNVQKEKGERWYRSLLIPPYRSLLEDLFLFLFLSIFTPLLPCLPLLYDCLTTLTTLRFQRFPFVLDPLTLFTCLPSSLLSFYTLQCTYTYIHTQRSRSYKKEMNFKQTYYFKFRHFYVYFIIQRVQFLCIC